MYRPPEHPESSRESRSTGLPAAFGVLQAVAFALRLQDMAAVRQACSLRSQTLGSKLRGGNDQALRCQRTDVRTRRRHGLKSLRWRSSARELHSGLGQRTRWRQIAIFLQSARLLETEGPDQVLTAKGNRTSPLDPRIQQGSRLQFTLDDAGHVTQGGSTRHEHRASENKPPRTGRSPRTRSEVPRTRRAGRNH